MRNDAALEDDKFQEIIRRVVDVARPERVILFGSAARGEMTAHSDVDCLVIAPALREGREVYASNESRLASNRRN